MKTKIILVLFLFCSINVSFAKSLKINVQNPNSVLVTNAPVVVKLSSLTSLKNNQLSQLAVYLNGKQISSQLDDLNGDGTPDELVFLVDLAAGEKKSIVLKTISEKNRIKFPREVYADLIIKEKDGTRKFVSEASSDKNDMYNRMHHHGIAFESALIAYRIYFDNKSTIDVYGKRKAQLEVETTGWYPNDEQLKNGYGDDILLVNSWVGVGTVKGFDGAKTLHVENFDRRTQRIVSQGNIRTVSEIDVQGWQYEGKKIDLKVRYIMYARHRDALCEISANADIDNLTTGVQQIGGGELLKDNNLVGSWGSWYPQGDTVKYKKETAGLGVYVPNQDVSTKIYPILSGVDNLVVFPVKKNTTFSFYLTSVSAKEEFCPIKSANDFFEYLKTWQQSLKPIEVK
ncbi:MAG: DUF4861 domain-containing protein [Paludibacter sp.]|jgi:hypothetical protein|nr:DUF4861 domain-containing protein [Paludibacter sp.]